MASFVYFLWISITISLGLIWALKRAESRKFPIELAFKITGWLLLVIPLGARLLHVFYEEPQYYLQDPINVLKVWQGGFVYYGGLLAGVIFCLIFFLKPRQKSFSETADFLTPVLCFGTGFGRIACFIQGCCYGSEWSGLWAISQRHPTQLYMFLWESLLLVLILKIENTKRFLKPGQLFLFWISLSALGRFIVEYFRADMRGPDLLGLTISQAIAAGLILSSALGFIKTQKKTV